MPYLSYDQPNDNETKCKTNSFRGLATDTHCILCKTRYNLLNFQTNSKYANKTCEIIIYLCYVKSI